jgi:hypothetical protein
MPQSGMQKKLDLKLDPRSEPVLGTPSIEHDKASIKVQYVYSNRAFIIYPIKKATNPEEFVAFWLFFS